MPVTADHTHIWILFPALPVTPSKKVNLLSLSIWILNRCIRTLGKAEILGKKKIKKKKHNILLNYQEPHKMYQVL